MSFGYPFLWLVWDAALAILTNPEVIAVDQDPLGVQGRLVQNLPPELQVWVKPLADGSRAAVLLNRASVPTTIAASLGRMGITTDSARVRDLWAQKDMGTFGRRYEAMVPSHGAVMLNSFAKATALPCNSGDARRRRSSSSCS